MFGLPRLAPAPNGFCGADVDDGTGTGTPDGGVDVNDFLFFFTVWEAGNLAADLDDGSGLGIPDDGVDANDLLYFLTAFEEGTRGGDFAALRFAWRGYLWDQHLQLYHVRHRAFDPKLMRWLQPDPLGEIDGPNPYAYVGWDPFNRIDPYGLDWVDNIIYVATGAIDILTLGLTAEARSAVGITDVRTAGTDVSHWMSKSVFKGTGNPEAAAELETALRLNGGVAGELADDPIIGEQVRAIYGRGSDFQQSTPIMSGAAEAVVMFTIMPGVNFRNTIELAADVSKGAAVVRNGERFFVVTTDGKRAEITAEQAQRLEVAAKAADAVAGGARTLKTLLTESEQAEFIRLQARYPEWMPRRGLDAPVTIRTVEENAAVRAQVRGQGHHPHPLKFGGDPNPGDMVPTCETRTSKNPVHTEITDFWRRVLHRLQQE